VVLSSTAGSAARLRVTGVEVRCRSSVAQTSRADDTQHKDESEPEEDYLRQFVKTVDEPARRHDSMQIRIGLDPNSQILRGPAKSLMVWAAVPGLSWR
jgi:hypothetical protein